MKKNLSKIVLAIVLIALGLMPARMVHAATAGITISGIVTNSGIPTMGIKIAVNCKGSHFANFVGFAATDLDGYYVVHTTTALCPLASVVEVRADKDGDGKFESSALGVAQTNTVINVVLGENIAVPELGWLGGLLGAGAALGVVSLMHRRYIRANVHA